jgi:glycerol uptake facilitator-like aquaporin
MFSVISRSMITQSFQTPSNLPCFSCTPIALKPIRSVSNVAIRSAMPAGSSQGLSEFVATAGLVGAILGAMRFRAEATPWIVGLYIASAYWFTASTSFANPAVTLARCLSDTFAGIAPASAPLFIVGQLAGAVAATSAFRLLPGDRRSPS